MDEEILEYLNKDFSTTIGVLSQIGDIWQRSVGSIHREQEQIKKHVKELRERHRTDQQTIADLRASVKLLEEKLKTANQDKEIYARKVGESEDHCHVLQEKLADSDEHLKAVLTELREQNDHVKKLQDEVSVRNAELARVRGDLRTAEETSKSLNSQLTKEREEWHTQLHEHDQSARMRMEAQKKDLEQKHKVELNAVRTKYNEAHRRMKTDFEKALIITSEEVEELTAQRDHYARMAKELVDEMDKFKTRIRQKWQQEAAEKFYDIATKMDDTDELLKRPRTPPKPDHRAKRLLQDFKNRSGANQQSTSTSPSEENSPIRKSARYSSTLPVRMDGETSKHLNEKFSTVTKLSAKLNDIRQFEEIKKDIEELYEYQEENHRALEDLCEEVHVLEVKVADYVDGGKAFCEKVRRGNDRIKKLEEAVSIQRAEIADLHAEVRTVNETLTNVKLELDKLPKERERLFHEWDLFMMEEENKFNAFMERFAADVVYYPSIKDVMQNGVA